MVAAFLVMDWVSLSICSALFLGVYDLCKKAAVERNAVPPVLFLSVVAGALVWAPLLVWSRMAPDSLPISWLRVQSLSWVEHGLVLAKAALVSFAWVFNYFAVKHLPVSVSAPIRSTSPLWTIAVAIAFMGERPAPLQWGGMVLVLGAFFALSLVGRLEGIHFHRNRWVGYMLIATWVGAMSAIYDKYLLQTRGLDAASVQCWFSIYLVLVLAPFCGLWRLGYLGDRRFVWRWSIPLIGVSLLVADFFYFVAVGHPDALISVISPVRRCAVLIPFVGGVVIYGEKNFRPKLVCILLLLLGVFLLNRAG